MKDAPFKNMAAHKSIKVSYLFSKIPNLYFVVVYFTLFSFLCIWALNYYFKWQLVINMELTAGAYKNS